MIRAVLFDFYGVWRPDIFDIYLQQAPQYGADVAEELQEAVKRYFRGEIDVEEIAGKFRFKMGRADIDASQFTLDENSVSPMIIEFMRELHGHFLKLGVLANLGNQEYKILSDFNTHNQVFEVIASPLSFQSSAPLLSNEIFAQALQAIGEPPRSCLVVSGNKAYQDFASSLGMAVVPFESAQKLRQDLEKMLASELA